MFVSGAKNAIQGRNMTTALYDYDFLKYEAASLAEDRSILVVHKQSGDEYKFKTRTEFYGNYRKKSGGWLAEYNKTRLSPVLVDEFEITDVQVPLPLSHAYSVVNNRIETINNRLGVSQYYGYIGKGDSFRVELSTILKYKGQRVNALKALQIEEVEHYLIKKHGAEIVTGLESDDQCVIDCTADKTLVLVGRDKDFFGTEICFFNPDMMDVPQKIKGLGKLYTNDKQEVKGWGRKFFYHQVMSQDIADNYAANSASEKRWGEKSSYNLLEECKTDKTCLEALVKGYKTLYPEKKVITGWRGNEIEIDWLYVLKENFNLARMLRWEGDVVAVQDVLNKLKISYE